MKGQILDYSVTGNSGSISGSDGNRYNFVGADWRGTGVPARGMTVDFEAEGNQAKAIYVALGSHSSAPATPGSKSKVAAGLLAIFLGGWGIHKFYLGFTVPGLIFLLTNTIGWAILWIVGWLPNFALYLVALIEGIIYLTKSDQEFEQQYVVQKKQWF
jgi:TM2 domain-containing membrane protein YozV